ARAGGTFGDREAKEARADDKKIGVHSAHCFRARAAFLEDAVECHRNITHARRSQTIAPASDSSARVGNTALSMRPGIVEGTLGETRRIVSARSPGVRHVSPTDAA